MAFYFGKPRGLMFQAGQSILLTLGEGWENRPFTIASAPHEAELMIATRMRESAFKSHLAKLEPGDAVNIDGPNGVMVLHRDVDQPAVFLAGGIGVTPFLSMLRDVAHRKLEHRVTLFYFNRRPQDAAFLEELQALEKSQRNFRLVAATERVSEPLLRRYVDDIKRPVYYFAGPPGMTMAVQGMLSDLGIAADAMRSEEFYGY